MFHKMLRAIAGVATHRPPGTPIARAVAALVAVCVLSVPGLGQWASFDPAAEPTVPTRSAPSGQLLVRPVLEGVDLGWFVLDTGASVNVITPRARAKLNPRRAGSTRSEDIAGHEVVTARWVVDELRLGPMTIHGAALTEIQLDNLTQHWGVQVAGLLGKDTFARAVFELDIAPGRVAIHDPRRYTLDDEHGGSASWGRLDLRGGVPHVPASFEGRKGRFFLDTGDGARVTFHAPAVGRYRLLTDRTTTSRTVHALRGKIAYHYGTLERFELAGHTFEKLAVAFTPRVSGVYLERYDTGRIGCGVLRPFRIVLDYPNRRYALIEQPVPADAAAAPAASAPAPGPDLRPYAGVYELPDGTRRRVWIRDDQLVTQRRDGPVLIARVEADDRFVYESLGIAGRFERDEAGAIIAMVVAIPNEPPERANRVAQSDPP